MKIYSKGCEYALRVLTQVPRSETKKNFRAREVCRKAKVPIASGRKVLQGLVEQGLLEAVPGPGGGYRFSKNPQKLSLLEIIFAVDGRNSFDHCVMGLPQCSGKHPCPAHQLWQKLKGEIKKQMGETHLHQIMKH